MWEGIILYILPFVLPHLIEKIIDEVLKNSQSKKILKQEFKIRILPYIKDMKDPISNMQDAYVRFASEEIDCNKFSEIIVDSSKEIKNITKAIVEETLDIYKKYPEEFKRELPEQSLVLLDDIEYHKNKESVDSVSRIFMKYYDVDESKRELKKRGKKISKMIDFVIPEDIMKVIFKINEDPNKKECLEEVEKQVLDLYNFKEDDIKKILKKLGLTDKVILRNSAINKEIMKYMIDKVINNLMKNTETGENKENER